MYRIFVLSDILCSNGLFMDFFKPAMYGVNADSATSPVSFGDCTEKLYYEEAIPFNKDE